MSSFAASFELLLCSFFLFRLVKLLTILLIKFEMQVGSIVHLGSFFVELYTSKMDSPREAYKKALLETLI